MFMQFNPMGTFLPSLLLLLGSMSACGTASSSNTGKQNEILDIESNVTLYDKSVLQLRILWRDTLPNDTSFNVLLSAMDPIECYESPCSVYGVQKPAEVLVIPENPMSYVELRDCNYMFGCNYTLTVETSNASISKKTSVAIPYCVLDMCSCKHAHKLPKVQALANFISNATINMNWSVRFKDLETPNSTTDDVLEAILMSRIYLKISEQTNPSLSWGGKLITIAEKVYDIQNLSYYETSDALQGQFDIHVEDPLSSKSVLNLHTYLIDKLQCAGPDNMLKIQVPVFSEPGAADTENDFNLRLRWILTATLAVLVVISATAFCCWQRRQRKPHVDLHKEEQYLSQFATVMEMEDNINYVDKDIEEAQAKGFADVFEVPHHAIRIEAEIGEGAFGRVYKATALNIRRMRGTTVVAVKQLKKNSTADEVAEFLREIEMLKGVGTHNNIVCFLGCCTIRAPYLMLMEYVGRGDLLSYLRTVRFESTKFRARNETSVQYSSNSSDRSTGATPVKYIELKLSTQSVDSDAESERQPKPSFAETTYTIIDDEEFKEPFEYILDHRELHNFALQIANGMRFLEEQEISHRDLAARNILIDDRKTLKISDFGLSRYGVYTNTKTRKLPLRWLSIEAIRDNIYSSQSDVWAYGVVLWEIGTLGASPYPTISNHELIPYLLSGKRLEKPEICTEQVYALMLQCWHEDPNERPTFVELYKALNPRAAYVDINSLSDDYVFPPIKDKDINLYK